MGDIKKPRSKYSKPRHPWQKARIEQERDLKKNYGLKNKKEIWRMYAILKHFQSEAKRLIADQSKQAEIEKENLLKKLLSLSLVKPNANLNEVLEITITNVLDRRLQTILCKKSLARTLKQSRQFITHKHITINGKLVDKPSHLVTESEITTIVFNERSSLNNLEHPERTIVEKKIKEEITKKKEDTE